MASCACGQPTWNGAPGQCVPCVMAPAAVTWPPAHFQPPPLVAVCTTPRCGKPTWNGQACQPCNSCVAFAPMAVNSFQAPVAATWQPQQVPGQPTHASAGPSAGPSAGVLCVRPGCGRPSWNGTAGEHCGKSCKALPAGAPAASAGAQPLPAPVCGCGKPSLGYGQNCIPGCPAGALCSRPGCVKPSFNRQTGQFCSKSCKALPGMPTTATAGVAIGPVCLQPGCGKPTWNQQPNEYCGKSCRAKPSGAFAKCVRPGCQCTASWNGLPGCYCCKSCSGGTPCLTNNHPKPSAPVPAATTPPPAGTFSKCANPSCPCTSSYDGAPTSYCCKSCQKGFPCAVNVHTIPAAPAAAPTAGEKCSAPGCAKPAWNNMKGGFCGKTHRAQYGSATPAVTPAAKAALTPAGKAVAKPAAKPAPGAHSSPTDWDDLQQLGEKWARANLASVYKVNNWYNNPGLKNSACPSRTKYEGGVTATGFTDCSSVCFGWHGTKTNAAAVGISWDNLDPRKRSGQVYGPGEYFSLDSSTSASYASSTEMLLVFAILDDPKVLNKCKHHVLNNPKSGNPMYCVPVGIITYGKNTSDPGMKST